MDIIWLDYTSNIWSFLSLEFGGFYGMEYTSPALLGTYSHSYTDNLATIILIFINIFEQV